MKRTFYPTSIIAIVAFMGTLLLASSFVGYDNTASEYGTIQAIGDAGSPNVFTFNKWEYVKAEVPNNDFEKVQVEIEINTSSVTCDWKDLLQNVKKKKDYFYVKKFPTAMVKIDGATRQADGSYLTEAVLTLKGKTKPVQLSFEVSDAPPYVIKGKGVVMRRKFGFTGNGPKDEVPVNFEITLP